MAKQPKPKTDTAGVLANLLQTSDPAEQVKRVATLLEKAQLQSVSMLLNLDPRAGFTVRYIGPTPPPYTVLYNMLDEARKYLLDLEREALKSNATSAPESTSGGSPEKPSEQQE